MKLSKIDDSRFNKKQLSKQSMPVHNNNWFNPKGSTTVPAFFTTVLATMALTGVGYGVAMLEGCLNQKCEEFYQRKNQPITTEAKPAVDLEPVTDQSLSQDTMER